MRAVVFDLDGTLVDTLADIHALAGVVLEAEGLPVVDPDTVRSFIGHGQAHFVERLADHAGIRADEAVRERMLARFAAEYAATTGLSRLYPGVRDMLAALAAEGVAMAICTNKPAAPTHSVLARFGLTPYFGTVICGDSLDRRKPDPAPLRASIAGLGAGRAVYVGDSEVDAQTAVAAGVPFVLFTRGYRQTPVAQLPHDAAFDDHAALPRVLESLAARESA